MFYDRTSLTVVDEINRPGVYSSSLRRQLPGGADRSRALAGGAADRSDAREWSGRESRAARSAGAARHAQSQYGHGVPRFPRPQDSVQPQLHVRLRATGRPGHVGERRLHSLRPATISSSIATSIPPCASIPRAPARSTRTDLFGVAQELGMLAVRRLRAGARQCRLDPVRRLEPGDREALQPQLQRARVVRHRQGTRRRQRRIARHRELPVPRGSQSRSERGADAVRIARTTSCSASAGWCRGPAGSPSAVSIAR